MVALDLQAELERLGGDAAPVSTREAVLGLHGEGLSLTGAAPPVSTSEAVLLLHGEDLTSHEPHLPDAVVFAHTAEEVSSVLAFANEHRIPVTPFGTGTSLEGHVIPGRGGIS